jgi:hypothetical protein
MKIFIRNAFFFFLTAIVLLLIATCVEGTDESDKTADDNITYGPIHYDKLDIKNEQVWMPNYNTGKISQMLLKFSGDRDVDVVINNPSLYKVVSGEIKKGILKFKIDKEEMNDSYLLNKDDLIFYIFNEWYNEGNGDIDITPSDVKGNIITVLTYKKDDSHTKPIEGVIREGFSGTNNSSTGDYIYYLYVDKNCKISAERVEKKELEYTFNKFELSLKAGWNTICKSETYTTTGNSSYSMKVSNPSIRWVIQKLK